MIGDPHDIRRWRFTSAFIALLLIALAAPPRAQDAASTLTLVSKDGRRPVPTTSINGRDHIALDDVAALFQVAVREDSLAGGFTLSYRGRTIVASADKPMAQVEGRVITLPSPVVRSGRRWLVPAEFLQQALNPIYDQRIEYRRAARLLLVGDLRVPRVSGRIDSPGPPTRGAIAITPAAAVNVISEAGRILVRVEADALDPAFPFGPTGLVDSVRIGDQANTVLITLSRQAAPARTTVTTADNTTRVAFEVPIAETRTAPPDTRPPETRPPSPESRGPIPELRLPESTAALDTIVIDAGHGGDQIGVRGAGGLEEKQLTLDVARRLRSMIDSRLGWRVILTREDDRSVSIDERAAKANNGKADLLISLHANGAPSGTPSGAEVFYDRLDREGEAVKRSAEAGAVSLPLVGGGSRTIDIVPWDLAQTRHVDASAMLATMLEEELRQRVPMAERPLQQGPMRLLSSANMPAALVEMAYLTNAEQEKVAGNDEFKNAVAQAIFNAIVRFRAYLEETPAP